MTEFRSEERADMGSASPELGFSFGLASASEVEKSLRYYEGANDIEVDDVAVELSALSQLFMHGLPETAWHMYQDVAIIGQYTLGQLPNTEKLIERHEAFLDEASNSVAVQVNEIVAYVNGMLTKIPSLVRKSEQSETALRELSVEWQEFSQKAVPKRMPADLIAEWSDGSSNVLSRGEDAIVDTSKLPIAVQHALRNYYNIYEASDNETDV